MGNKYINELTERDFVYPNNDISIYDVDIVHNVNSNCVSGSVNSVSATTISSTGFTISSNITWLLNGAEPFLSALQNNTIRYVSVHIKAPSQQYYKPWRVVIFGSANLGVTGVTTNLGVFIVPASLGLTSFTNGIYDIEYRFLGKNCVYPVCTSITITTIAPAPTATPLPTPTATAVLPTPTPTATSVPCFSGATINVTDTGWIKYNNCAGTDVYVQYTTTGNKTITDCLRCDTIREGIPFADLAAFTVTNCGNSCSSGPSPTPEPTATSNNCTATEWRIDNSSNGYDIYWSGLDCGGYSIGGTIGAYNFAYTTCVADGTLSYSGFPIVTVAAIC